MNPVRTFTVAVGASTATVVTIGPLPASAMPRGVSLWFSPTDLLASSSFRAEGAYSDRDVLNSSDFSGATPAFLATALSSLGVPMSLYLRLPSAGKRHRFVSLLLTIDNSAGTAAFVGGVSVDYDLAVPGPRVASFGMKPVPSHSSPTGV